MKSDLRIPPEVMKVVRRLRAKKFEAFIVGGAVRDLILKKKPGDWDVASNARPREVLRLFPRSLPTGIDFGTVTVRVKKFPVQVTTYRKEGLYKDRRRPSSLSFGGDIYSDLARRDFTVNAMALDPISGSWVDPFHGKRDLKNGILRAVGNARERFEEDVLRIVRGGRFVAQLHLAPHPEVTRAARAVAPLLRHVSAERIRDELTKLLLSPTPSRGIIWMLRTRILAQILPELTDCRGVKQGGWHQYDVFRHTLVATDRGEPEITVRLALLLHDIAKPLTRTRDSGGYHFYGHDRKGAEMSRKILTRLKFPRKLIDDVEALIRHHLFEDGPISRSDTAVRRLILRVGEGRLEKLIQVRRGDTLGCGTKHRVSPALKKILARARKIEKARQALTLKDLRVTGRDVMRWKKLPPGPQVGVILRNILEEVLKHPEINQKKNLKSLILGR